MAPPNYSENEASCKVVFFKPSGKCYMTEAVVFRHDTWKENPRTALIDALKFHLGARWKTLVGLRAVCMDPYTEHSYPVMVEILSEDFK